MDSNHFEFTDSDDLPFDYDVLITKEPALKKKLPMNLAHLLHKIKETETYIPLVKKLPNKFEDLSLKVDQISVLLHNFVTKD